MLYFAYTKEGAFDGFYDTDIHEVIPNSVLNISEELWKALLTGKYKVNLEVIDNFTDKMCTLSDKDSLFLEIEDTPNIEMEDYLSPTQKLGQQVSNLEIQIMMMQQMMAMQQPH